MITTYHRPRTLDEALTLLTQPNRIPLGGGTFLSHGQTDSIEVVDLQSLNLDFIKKSGNTLEIGAAVTLQQLLDSEHCPQALKTAIKLEAPLNIRNAATVAGTLVASDGRSTLGTVLLATDARLELAKLTDGKVEKRTISVGEYLPLRDLQGSLITSIVMPINNRLAFEYVSRTPADKPIVCAALSRWNSGRTRLAVGGYGKDPLLAMDGTEAEGIETAARNSFHEATDEWASAQYRMDVAAILARRCLENIA
jgi:CO/xanthine dehydrogenase FAD-binding subunit